MSLNDRTVSFYKNAKIENRKKEGQYMTPTNIVKETINNIPFTQSDIILEPSYGTGQFFDELIKMKHKSIYGVEKDKEIFDSSKNDYKKYKLFNDNYLLLVVAQIFIHYLLKKELMNYLMMVYYVL